MDIPLELNLNSSKALYRQLHDSLRAAIIEGLFEAGSRVPASRALARSIGVSRITVTECYERLVSEGYLETRRGSGTFVSRQLPDLSFYTSHDEITPTKHKVSYPAPRFSRYGAAVDLILQRPTPPETLRFDRHGPDVSHFPTKVWARLLARRLQKSETNLFQYAHDFRGDPDLRRLIARYLAQARAVRCDPDQILIVSGSQQAIYLSARILLDEGDRVAMESPGYYFAGRAFSSQGAEIVPIRVDKHGIKVAELRKQKDIRMVYVTPSHQFPTGVSLTLPRRKALLAWARKNNAFIIEDDYDSEFRYRERPLPALKGITPDGPIIYTGSFSKMLFPSLRLAYVVLPNRLFTAFRTAKLLNDMHSSVFHEHILADFLAGGHLESHLRRMRTLYDKRRTLLIRMLRDHFGNKVTISGDEAGMFFLARFRSDLSEVEAWDRAFKAGVQLERLFWPGGVAETEPGYLRFVFAYGALSDKELQLVGPRLASAFLT